MAAPAERRVRLGSFELDPQTGELLTNGCKTRLRGKPLQILGLLLERAGELVTREEIRQKLWPDGTFVDFEHNINTAVKQLREALGDDAEHPRFIETLPRHGYRCICPVEVAAPPPIPGQERLAATDEGAVREPPRPVAQVITGGYTRRAVNAVVAAVLEAHRSRARWRRWAVAGMIAAGLATGLAVLIVLNVASLREHLLPSANVRSAARLPKIASIAVLPLESFSADPEQQFFADEMTEELITTLGKIHALRVISRTSVMRFKGTRKSLPEIGRELNVDAIVEGTVSRSGNRVRITANLVYAPTDRHLWAESYEKDLRDSLALQAEVARAIASRIQIEITPPELASLAPGNRADLEARELYLKGQYFLSKRTEKGFREAIQCFSQAIEREPQYAQAYAGLADSYTLLARYDFLAPREAYPKAKEAATKAIAIEDTSGEAHASLAWAAFVFDWRWDVAEQEFARALQLDPSYAAGHHWRGLYWAAMGRFNEAAAELKVAHELDPLSLSINSSRGMVAYLTRDYDSAIVHFRETLALDPNFAEAHADLADALEQKSMFEQALAQWQGAVQVSGERRFGADLAHAYALCGRGNLARRTLAKLIDSQDRSPLPVVQIAATYVALGDADQALHWLERGYLERQADMVFLGVDPQFDHLRADPRFQALLRRMNLPQ